MAKMTITEAAMIHAKTETVNNKRSVVETIGAKHKTATGIGINVTESAVIVTAETIVQIGMMIE